MRSAGIVGVKLWSEYRKTLVVGCEEGVGGELFEKRAVESHCFSVGLEPKLPRTPVGDAQVVEGILENDRRGVVAGVVRRDPFDGDAFCGEEGDGVAQELAQVGAFSSSRVWRTNQPAVIVDSDVEVVVADQVALLLSGRPHFASVHLRTSAFSDPAEFLDVDVEELAGSSRS
jgi:hypothetical protein